MNYHDINHCDMLNGNGIRVSLWISGCSVSCNGCQNPQTWDFNSGILFDNNAKEELFDALSKPYIQGLTLTGGHPLENENISDVYDLCKEVKEKFPDKNIWLYTGYLFEEINSHPIMEYIDVVVDGPYIEKLRDVSLHWRGSTNQRIIDVPETIKQNKIITIQN